MANVSMNNSAEQISRRCVTSVHAHPFTVHCKEFDNAGPLIGPLVHDVAPYSAIGITNLQYLAPRILPKFEGTLILIPRSLNVFSHWQYGNGSHASSKRRIIGSVVILVNTDLYDIIEIRHFVLDGESQWVVCRNVTTKCDIQHKEQN